MVKPVTGSEAEVRADGPGDETTARWSPDGRYLAYVTTSEPGTPVYLVAPEFDRNSLPCPGLTTKVSRRRRFPKRQG